VVVATKVVVVVVVGSVAAAGCVAAAADDGSSASYNTPRRQQSLFLHTTVRTRPTKRHYFTNTCADINLRKTPTETRPDSLISVQ